MKVRLIHGIHSPEGNNNMSAFAPHLAAAMPGAKVEVYSYGFMGFWQARWRNYGVAERFADLHIENRSTEPEVWVTHSNGAAIAFMAVEDHGALPDMIINFNPALDHDLTPLVPRVEVIHSDNDRWVNLSQWIPFHIWGDQGKVGYKGNFGNTINHNASKIGGKMAYDCHTGAFHPSRISAWAYFAANRIDETLGG